VLPAEVFALLALEPGGVYVDCTAGLGGHAALAAERVAPGGTVVLNDLDAGNLELSRAAVERHESVRVCAFRGSFGELPGRLTEAGLRADAVLADLGFSSNQVDDASRGLSFKRDGPLDMRLDPSSPVTAEELVMTLPEAELADILYRFGEERASRLIARKIVAARRAGPISTTGALAGLVRSVLRGGGGRRGGPSIDPATRTFQALRIAVNDELGHLDAFLASVRHGAASDRGWLRAGARVAVLAFHSLEDRPVKQAFASMAQDGLVERLTRRPTVASEAERASNPRARSAKLRAVRTIGRTGDPGGERIG
jgi:16S rRNA (cytosine1402-N4)-methyltransferase